MSFPNSFGMSLPKDSSDDILTFIRQLLSTAQLLSPALRTEVWFWIDSTPLAYQNWQTGEPNNAQGDENRAVMNMCPGGNGKGSTLSEHPSCESQGSPKGEMCQE